MTSFTDNDRERCRVALDACEAVLTADLRTAAPELPDARNPGGTEHAHAAASDPVDLADERLHKGLRCAAAERDIGELREIDAARARLDALPAAARCIACQGRYEQAHPDEVQLPPDL
ncbi:transcriptional regulator, TraR/DksA family [Variovorax sp. OK605]|uniref:hypothetical protein n=1 Tax=Variovorax sp. OK605 TaxID=1855317 RepID=UPI0008F1713A|nr:hypothetical protein [Variovorax sp. OK605]SFQ30790.1 transcriptional regulator, TraR/DksA family [Variovorax sp. OK605]